MQVPENQWYVVLSSPELRREPLGVERLGSASSSGAIARAWRMPKMIALHILAPR